MEGIDKLIINSAYKEPELHWKYNLQRRSFELAEGRRSAGYIIADPNATRTDDQGIFKELDLVNKIRPRVKQWRENGYPGVTGITKRLLEHWHDKDAREYPFFWCQLDAVETLIWLVEAPAAEKVGISIPSDGGDFQRICTKLCTGGGKTILMAMLIAWQVTNKVTYPQDKRFSKNVLVVAPGLTVKSRLQVLYTGGEENYYIKFNVVPGALYEKLLQGKIKVINWQMLAWDTEEKLAKKKSVDKRGVKSDEAYTREVLGDMANARNILVINDEAHHAWRKNPEVKVRSQGLSAEEKKTLKEEEEKATIWINGLDRIHKTRGIHTCYDFSATPFAPSGKKNDDEALFGWIVSDFGLNDGIESGLVKTPRVVVRDDATPDPQTFKSKLYHIYKDETVRDDINRKADETEPLPDLLTNAYYVLGRDWEELYKSWKEQGSPVPPVMITVANRTETAARIKYAFDHKRIGIDLLSEPEYTIHIDSKTMDSAEEGSSSEVSTEDGTARKLSKKDLAQLMRETVDTVGQRGKPGEKIRNVISVGMLTEGWDAKTVTHIMGLRAFSSQLLCEQVVGRGLRRTSYEMEEGTDLFTAEYVNIFGIPFTFLPHESTEKGTAPVTPPKTQIESLKEKSQYRIDWPNILRIDRDMDQTLKIDISSIPILTLDATETRLKADLAPIVEGKEDLARCTEIDLEKLDRHIRLQNIVFTTAAQVYEMMNKGWQQAGTKYNLFGQVIRITEEFLASDRIKITPSLYETTPVRRRLMLILNMNRIVQHLWDYIKMEQTKKLIPVLDSRKPIRSTADMLTWFTSKPCQVTQKSQISHCVFDSGWESTESYILEKNENVVAWAKNDHLGFEIFYLFNGVVSRYIPDFLVKLKNGKMLVLETKGQETERDRKKKMALSEWIEAVNQTGEYGEWCNRVSYNVKDVDGIIEECMR